MEEVKLVEKALKDFQDNWGGKVSELDAKVTDIMQKGAGGYTTAPGARPHQSMGRKAVDSEQFRALLSGDTGSPAAPGDTFSQPDRLGYIVPGAQRNLTILDLLPIEQATSNSVSCTREASYTNSAAGQTEEGAAKPESAMTFSLVEKPVITL